MKSFLFCTSYFQTSSWERWKRWLDYCFNVQDALGVEKIILIDDGSPLSLVSIPVEIVNADKPLPKILPEGPVMFRFDRHLGRSGTFRFPGWWRSFTYSSQIAQSYSFEKIIHLESDAFIMSKKMIDYIRQLRQGWTAFWCPRYNRPESAVQVICEDEFHSLQDYFHAGEDYWGGNICAETTLPFTHVDRTFLGDRYGEYIPVIPDEADYVAQTPPRLEVVAEKKAGRPVEVYGEAQRRLA